MDYATLVGDLLLALATVGAAYAARATKSNSKRIAENTHKLDLLTKQELDALIHATVVEVLATEEGDRLRSITRTVLGHPRTLTDE